MAINQYILMKKLVTRITRNGFGSSITDITDTVIINKKEFFLPLLLLCCADGRKKCGIQLCT